MEYYKFQRQGIDWLKSHFKCILADEMGLGKTVQAIGLVNECPGIKKVLIVCPASLKLNWAKELRSWLRRDMSVAVLSGSPKMGEVVTADVNIINYDILAKWGKKLRAVDWDAVFYDEAHYLKNAKAQRTKVALSLNANRLVFMTGTPMTNRPCELFNITSKIGLFQNRKVFEVRYCDAKLVRKFGMRIWDNTGSSNLDELKAKLQPVMLRRLKKDVLTDLPDKTHQIVELTGCREMFDGVEWFDGLPKHNSVTPDVRRLAGEAKVPAVVSHIQSVLEEKDKVIVFAHHQSVVGEIAGSLHEYNSRVITGNTPQKARHRIVEEFQTDPTVRVIVCNIQAAGVGLTLTASDVVMFAELDWVPGNMKQAEDRAHRIGQKNNVLVQYLVAPGVDATIGEALAAKIKNMEAIGC